MAKKIAIVTDSNSGITQANAKEFGVTVVPTPFFINGEFNHNIKCCYYINSQKKVYLRRNTYNEKNRNHDR